jgi:heme/copper-type cytochrome/quinol oxidase subunit 2
LSAPLAGTRLSGKPPRPSHQNTPKEAGTERAMRSAPARALSHIVMVVVMVVFVFVVVMMVVVVVHLGECGDRRHGYSRTKNDGCNNFLQHVVISP